MIKNFFFLSVGLIFLWHSLALEIGTASEMGPGFFPAWLSIIVIVLALIQIYKND